MHKFMAAFFQTEAFTVTLGSTPVQTHGKEHHKQQAPCSESHLGDDTIFKCVFLSINVVTSMSLKVAHWGKRIPRRFPAPINVFNNPTKVGQVRIQFLWFKAVAGMKEQYPRKNKHDNY